MITIECAWCEADVRLDGLDATRVECPDCGISVEFAPDATASALDLPAAA